MDNIFKKKTLAELSVGDFALFTKTISASDVTLFAGISGDFSPIYLNKEFGEASIYAAQLSHPMLIASMIGGAVFRLLKPDCFMVRRSFDVIKPFTVGDTLTARAEVISKDESKNQVTLLLEAYNSARELVVRGEGVEQMEIRK